MMVKKKLHAYEKKRSIVCCVRLGDSDSKSKIGYEPAAVHYVEHLFFS